MSSKSFPSTLYSRAAGGPVDALQLESTLSLKRSLSSYRGHLTRVYGELDSLMKRKDALCKVIERKSSLDKIFVNYQGVSLKLARVRFLQASERDAIVLEYERQLERKESFDETYLGWIRSSDEGKSTEKGEKSEIDLEARAMMDVHVYQPSVLSKARTRSSHKSKSKPKLMLAQLKLKQVQEEQELMMRKRKLERERERILHDNQLRIEELEMEKQMHDARADLQRAELESQFSDTEDEEQDDISEVLTGIQRQNSKEIVESYLESYDSSNIYDDFDSVSLDDSTYPVPIGKSSGLNSKRAVSNSDQLQELLKYQRDTLQLMALGVDMPKREFLQFDGDPTKYPRFIKNFEVNVEQRIKDNNTRLSYLIQLCSGKAKEAIENCVILPEDKGYNEARDILRKHFGEKHTVVRALINKVARGPQIKANEPEKLSQLARDMKSCLISATEMNYAADINSMDNMEKIVRRLPVHLQAKWADDSGTLMTRGIEPIFSYLVDFVEKKAAVANTTFGRLVGTKPDSTVAERLQPSSQVRRLAFAIQDNGKTIPKERNSQVKGPTFDSTKSDSSCCLYCNGNHQLSKCFKFKNNDLKERKNFVRQQKLCDNCLRKNHTAWNCRNFPACQVSGCKKRHHSLLHATTHAEDATPESTDRITSSQEDVVSGSADKSQSSTNRRPSSQRGDCGATSQVQQCRVCMKIVPVKVNGNDGGPELETYAFLDNGSDTTLCLNELVDELQLPGRPTNFTLTTVNGESCVISGNEVRLQVKSLIDDEYINLDRVLSVKQLPVAERSIASPEDATKWKHLKDLQFPMLENKKVTILIGSDVPEAHWSLDQRLGQRKQPYAVRTLLGWTLAGPLGDFESNNHVNLVHAEQEGIAEQLERMYNSDFNEALHAQTEVMSQNDRRALTILQNSTQLVDGHYQMDLPWRSGAPVLPNNKSLAEKRLRLLKRRLERDHALHSKYKETMDDYIRNNHAREVPEEALMSQGKCTWYLPHHPVVHPQKPSKVRIVFDCAAKFCGVSLNDQLYRGPNMTNSLVGVLLRFRQDHVALIADIERMFHQVRVSAEDCNALRFLWWTGGDLFQEPTEHQMLVHLFGAKSSPCCAAYALRQTAEDNKHSFSNLATDTVKKNFYVDDCLKSVPNTDEAIKLVKELSGMLSKGGFHLTKWISNDREVITTVPEHERATSVKDLDLEKLPVDRALGMEWDVEEDTIRFRTVDKPFSTTRRGILSAMSSIYDPLGYVAPLVLPIKRLLQDLCKLKIGWDDCISHEYLTTWHEWQHDLHKLKNISVPRCIKPRDFKDVQSVQVHNFADASESGYGAVSYLRLVDVNGRIHCSFLMAKSRVAPLKKVTIPRLELTAATVAVGLSGLIQRELDVPIHKIYFWTDSILVLHYILNNDRVLKTFVANRIATIHDSSDPSQWHHVDSRSNPADCTSRGLRGNELEKLKDWHSGPEFLRKKESHWPKQPHPLPEIKLESLELKKVTTHVSAVVQGDVLSPLIHYYSSWYALQRAIAWLLRFKKYLLCKSGKMSQDQLICSNLKVSELTTATNEIVKLVQREHFLKEIKAVRESSKLPRSSRLRKIDVTMINGILCVGGRLQHANLQYCSKHPMILPSNHHVTDVIIREYHEQEGHVGPSQVLATLREKFWILRGPSTVKRVTSKCLNCRRWNSRPCEQVMAPLPIARVSPGNPPFTSTGVDYFGPIQVKVKRSTEKRYGCVFTCLACRAVHIEVSHNLSTDSFIQAFTRFVSRRGPPSEIFSDNGTNFKGAESDIKAALKVWNQHMIESQLCKRGVQWHFNAPYASHTGGVWERMIRSIRTILRHLLGDQLVKDETLLTFLAEIEKILNDRPLTRLTDNHQDLDVLTPNMLLLCRPNPCSAPGEFSTTDRYSKCWKQAQYLADVFWKRWSKEYLPTLQMKQKWLVPRRNLAIGDLVLLIDEKTPRGQWAKGIVEETFPDRFGIVRQVTVKTATSRLHRDCRKLTLLEGQIQ